MCAPNYIIIYNTHTEQLIYSLSLSLCLSLPRRFSLPCRLSLLLIASLPLSSPLSPSHRLSPPLIASLSLSSPLSPSHRLSPPLIAFLSLSSPLSPSHRLSLPLIASLPLSSPLASCLSPRAISLTSFEREKRFWSSSRRRECSVKTSQNWTTPGKTSTPIILYLHFIYCYMPSREVVQELTDEYIASTRHDYISRGSANVSVLDPLNRAKSECLERSKTCFYTIAVCRYIRIPVMIYQCYIIVLMVEDWEMYMYMLCCFALFCFFLPSFSSLIKTCINYTVFC